MRFYNSEDDEEINKMFRDNDDDDDDDGDYDDDEDLMEEAEEILENIQGLDEDIRLSTKSYNNRKILKRSIELAKTSWLWHFMTLNWKMKKIKEIYIFLTSLVE